MMRLYRNICVLWALVFLNLAGDALAQATGRDAIALLTEPGHHAIIRHARAPGSGDPADLTLGDCTTQRNLDVAGRRQAERLGDALREAGIEPSRILSSEWCRTLETARLMDLGPVTPFAGLNSTWRRPEPLVRERADMIRDALLALDPNETAILVTHASNIAALTGRSVASGAGIVLRVVDGGLEAAGTFEAPRS